MVLKASIGVYKGARKGGGEKSHQKGNRNNLNPVVIFKNKKPLAQTQAPEYIVVTQKDSSK